jgi:hypothetical protein
VNFLISLYGLTEVKQSLIGSPNWRHGYGYTYLKPALPRIASSNGQFRIIFFTIHPDTKDRLAVGAYHAAQLIPDAMYAELLRYFRNSRILQRRAQELEQVIGRTGSRDPLTEVIDSIQNKYLSVYCPVSEVEIFTQHIPLERISGDQVVGHRFRGFTYLVGPYTLTSPTDGRGNANTSEPTAATPLAEDAYYRETSANLRIIIPRHKKLSNAFCAWLLRRHGIRAAQEQNRVDVRFSSEANSVLAEIKICYGVSTTKAIREALGQLLEYNHYPVRTPARSWLIVLDQAPSQTDKKYVDLLRDSWSLPVSLGWSVGEEFEFHHFAF